MQFLIHSAEYYEKQEGSRYDGGYAAPITISNVLIQPSTSVKKTGTNEEKLLKALLVLDAVNTKPFVKPVYQSKIVFDGEEMIVQAVREIYGFTLHHYEVDLV
jgi:hypothetical protein